MSRDSAFEVDHWALWNGRLSDAHRDAFASMGDVIADMNRPSDPVIYSWYEHAQWNWKQWEYSSVLQALPPNPKELRVLDAGCGYTPLIRHLGALGLDAYGFDWDVTEGESDLKRSATLRHGDRVHYHQQDILSMNWPSNYFDVTISVSVLEHLYQASGWLQKVVDKILPSRPFHSRNIAAALAELVRVTKPRGRIVLTMDCGFGGGIPVRAVERLFDISIVPFPSLETIRSYWRADPYYSTQNRVYRGTPRDYTGFCIVLTKRSESLAATTAVGAS